MVSQDKVSVSHAYHVPCLVLQICLVGADGHAILRRIIPVYDPVAAEQEALDICKVPCFSTPGLSGKVQNPLYQWQAVLTPILGAGLWAQWRSAQCLDHCNMYSM